MTERLTDRERIAHVLEGNRYRIARMLSGNNPTTPLGTDGEEAMWHNIADEVANTLGLQR